ncbi:hypothetical protein Tco_0512616 [Tanacetum coccineum]
MVSNIKKFKCLIHFNETQRGSILSEDLTYSMLHEMVMQKFKLEANAVINLSFKLSSFDFAVDITDDADKFMSFEPDIPETPVYKAKPNISKQHSQQSEVEKGKIFDNKDSLILVVRFTSPPNREFVDEMIATIDPVDIDTFSANQVKLILTNYVGYDKNSPTFLYIKKPNCSLDSCLVPFEDAIQERDTILMYAHHNRLHVYVSRVELSPLVVAELFRDETNKRENQGKPSCAKKLFD